MKYLIEGTPGLQPVCRMMHDTFAHEHHILSGILASQAVLPLCEGHLLLLLQPMNHSLASPVRRCDGFSVSGFAKGFSGVVV